MVSLYPRNLDAFRAYVTSFDEMIAPDLVDLVDAVIAIETELGLRPAGEAGTIFGRLFGTGNISEINPGWRRLKWGMVTANGYAFSRERTAGFAVSWSPPIFEGAETVFGEDIPAAFGALQGPLTTTGPTGRKQAPWRTALNDTKKGSAAWYGQDGDGTVIGGVSPRNPELNVGNSVPVTWGYVIWSLS